MGKRGQMSLEHLLLVSSVIVFVAIVALATRYVITAGGSNTGTSGNLMATLKASYAAEPTAIELPEIENPAIPITTATSTMCTPGQKCGTKTPGIQNSSCPEYYTVTPCQMTCDQICSSDGNACNDCSDYKCEALCIPPVPTCSIAAVPDAGIGPFSSTITASFSNLPSGTAEATMKCSAADPGAAEPIAGNIATRSCAYAAVGTVAEYVASAEAGGASCQAVITDSPEPPCAGEQDVRVSTTALLPGQQFKVYAKFIKCADNSMIFGGRRVLYYPTNMRRMGFRFGDLYSSSNRNDVYSSGPSGAYSVALKADAALVAPITLAANPAAVSLVDVDGDGLHEYVQTLGTNPNTVQMDTTGTTTWSLNAQYSGCKNVLAADYDGDGLDDSGVLCSNNFTAYKSTPASPPIRLWSVQNFSGNISYNGNAYEFDVAKMNCEGTAEVAIPFGTTGLSNIGIAVYNATNGTVLYRHNQTGNGEPRAITHLDADMDGCYDTWAMLTQAAGNYFLWLVNKNGILSRASLGLMDAPLYEIAGGDLNGDGFNNDIVFIQSGGDYWLRARTIGPLGSITNLWNFQHYTLRWNMSGGGSGISNDMRVSDLDRDGLSDIVYVGNGGVVTILNSSGNVTVRYNGSYSAATPNGDAQLTYGKSPIMDISVNSSDNSTLIGWGDGTDLSQFGFNAGNLYVYEYQPCKISIGGGPLAAMDWDRNERKWAYSNASGMPAGTFGYAVYCDGNFSNVGSATAAGTFAFS